VYRVLEAVFYDLLTKDSTAVSIAMKCDQAPKKKGGVPRDIWKNTYEDQWSLNDLIKVATSCGMSAGTLHQLVDVIR
jgi:hypothetical protein